MSPMVLAIHNELGKALYESGLSLEERRPESPLQIALGEAVDECLFFVSSLEEIDQPIERLRGL